MTSAKTKTEKNIAAAKQKPAPAGLDMAVFDMRGEETAKISLPVEIFGLKVNKDLIKQVVEAQMSQARQPLAHAKDRSEVSGGGKKPWRQKGTGRARHGSTRSPIWRGGGITFGPRKEKNFYKKINKKMKRQALLMILSGKAQDGEIIILDVLKIDQPKTKEMAQIVSNLRTKVKNDLNKGALIVMPEKDENIIRAGRNLPKILTMGAQSLNAVDLLSYKYLLMPKNAIEAIKQAFIK